MTLSEWKAEGHYFSYKTIKYLSTKAEAGNPSAHSRFSHRQLGLAANVAAFGQELSRNRC